MEQLAVWACVDGFGLGWFGFRWHPLGAFAAGTPVAALLSTPAFFDQLMKLNNPDLLYADHDGNGYASATVTPSQFVAIFNKVKGLNSDGSAPADALAKRTRLTIQAGAVAVTVEDGV